MDLKPNTTYYFLVRSTDQFGNTKVDDNNGALYNFSTVLFQLKIVSLSVSVTNESATITWTSRQATNATVWYGTSPTELNMSNSDSQVTLQHDIKLVNLSEDTKYYFIIEGYDNQGIRLEARNGTQPFSFITADYTPSKVLPLKVTLLNDTALFSIQLNEPANVSILLGQDPANLTIAVRSFQFLEVHALTVANLQSYTSYYYRLVVADHHGNERTIPSMDKQPLEFRRSDYLPPVLSHPLDVFLDVGESVDITWTVKDSTPRFYTVTIDGNLLLNETITKTFLEITLTCNATTTGTHEIMLTVVDFSGLRAKDVVVIVVRTPQTSVTISSLQFLETIMAIILTVTSLKIVRRKSFNKRIT